MPTYKLWPNAASVDAMYKSFPFVAPESPNGSFLRTVSWSRVTCSVDKRAAKSGRHAEGRGSAAVGSAVKCKWSARQSSPQALATVDRTHERHDSDTKNLLNVHELLVGSSTGRAPVGALSAR